MEGSGERENAKANEYVGAFSSFLSCQLSNSGCLASDVTQRSQIMFTAAITQSKSYPLLSIY